MTAPLAAGSPGRAMRVETDRHDDGGNRLQRSPHE